MELKEQETQIRECDNCRMKSGSPYLCESCLYNRSLISNSIPKERIKWVIEGISVEDSRVGKFVLGDKVMEFANELLEEYKKKTLEALGLSNKE